MSGLGLEGAFGAGGAADALKEILRERFTREQALRDQARQDQELSLRQSEAAQRAKIGDATLQSLSDERAARTAATQSGEASKILAPLAPNDVIDPSAMPIIRAGNQMSLVNHQAAQPAMGAGFEGPMPAGQTAAAMPEQDTYKGSDKQRSDEERKQIVGRLIASMPAGSRERNALEYEQGTGRNAPAGMFEPKPRNPLPVHDTATGLMRPNEATGVMEPVVDASGKTVQGYHPAPDKLTKVEHKGADGRTVIEWLPQSELKGKTFQKGVSSTTDSRLASAEAVNQTGNDIIAKLSDPAYAAKLGPAMGRYSKVQDFIGNPPPEFSELAGAIESYSLANMGVHGMRSAQGAQLIAKLLNQPHTPESMVAAIKGLNKFSEHFMQNEGRTTKTTTADTASASDPLGIRR